MSRYWGGDPARLALMTSLSRIVPGAAVMRIHPDGTVTAYRLDRTTLRGNRTHAQDRRVAELLRGYFRAVDWKVGHDFYIGDGRLCTAPLPDAPGSWPARDRTFGSAPGPTYLPTARTGTGIEGAL